MGDTNRVSLYAMKEDTWGTTPTNQYKTVRMTGESIGFRIANTTSNELRSDRQVADLIQTSASNDGGFNFELSYGSLDDFLAAVLFAGDWVGVGGGQATTPLVTSDVANMTVIIDPATNKFTFGSAFGTLNFKVGQQFRLYGSAGYDGVYTVLTTGGTGNREITVSQDITGVSETLDDNPVGRITPYPMEYIVSAAANGSITIAQSGSTITLGSDHVGANLGIIVGQWIRITGAGNTANHGFHRVTGWNPTTRIITCANSVFADDVLDNDPIGYIRGAYIRNGTTRTSFTLEKKFGDMSTVTYATYKGMIPGSMSLTLESGAVFNGSFTFLGKSAVIGTSSAGAGTPIAASTTEVMNATSDLRDLQENDVSITNSMFFQSLGITIENALRGKPAIGVIGNSDVGAGRFNVTGSISAYFNDKSLYEKYVNGTETSIAFRVQDDPSLTASNAYIFDMPRVKFSNGNIVAGGPDADVMAELEYQALLDTVYPFTMQICRFVTA